MNASMPVQPKRQRVARHWGIFLCGFCLLNTFAGCGDPHRKRLVGLWELDHSERVEKRIADADEFASASKMTIRFGSGGKLSTVTKMGSIDGQKQGSWKFLEFDEETRVMRVECTIGMQTTEHEIEFVDEDQIKLVPPNMAGLSLKLNFRRGK